MVRPINTILLNEKNELVHTTPKEIIMQKSKLVETLQFLTDPFYKGIDMSEFTMRLEYKLPVSQELKTVILVKSPDLYEGMLEFKLPVDTDLTQYAGDVELQVTFSKLERTELGKMIQKVRKSQPMILKITPISDWSNFIPDGLLDAIDQRILKQDAQIKELQEVAEQFDMTKADNLSYSSNRLQLTANGAKIGDAVIISSSGGSTGEGLGYEIIEF